MSRYLLDVNTVLALLDPRHIFHEMAQAWAASEPEALWLTCPLVQNGVMRVAAHASYPNSLGTVRAVREILQSFCASSRHELCPDDVCLLDDRWIAQPEALTPARLTDLYLVALARHHRARLATFDRRIPADAIVGGRETVFLLGG